MKGGTQFQVNGSIIDGNWYGFKPIGTWDKDFSLDFEEVVPAMCTNLLLVEDDNVTSGYIKNLAKRSIKNPLRVRSFSSAEKAGEYIYSLRSHNLPGPDYAIVDFMLTGAADGLWLCKLLERNFPETTAILISSLDKQELKNKMEEYNIHPYFIQKPITPTNLFGYLS